MPIDTYAPRINQVADHISADLAGDLSLTHLADLAGFSQFHFHRVFKQYTGENLNRFVVRRRLERATQLMRVTARLPLTRIAIACGFESSSDFSRAFKRQFGLAPSSWDRLTPLTPLEDSKIRQTPAGFTLYTRAELAAMTRNNEFDVRIEQRAAERLAMIRITNAYANPERIMAATETLLDWAGRVGVARPQLVGMSEDDPDVTPAALCRYDVCVAMPEGIDAALEADMSWRHFPACTLAMVHCAGDIVRVDRVWQFLWRHWLPHSGYLPDNLPAMERYVRAPREIGWLTFDIDCCVPIVFDTGGG